MIGMDLTGCAQLRCVVRGVHRAGHAPGLQTIYFTGEYAPLGIRLPVLEHTFCPGEVVTVYCYTTTPRPGDDVVAIQIGAAPPLDFAALMDAYNRSNHARRPHERNNPDGDDSRFPQEYM